MSGGRSSSFAVLERLYERESSDPSFTEVLARLNEPLTEEELAEVIEADGRRRIRLGRPVDLDRYFEAITDLRERPDALDAAIDVSLRAIAGSSRIDARAIEMLAERHADLESAIYEAAAINNAMWSTNGLREMVAQQAGRTVPCDFGPLMPDGRPRYELRRLLGTGAAGEVYLANDRQLAEEEHEALVAVKILAQDDEQSNHDRLHRSDEATRVRRIDHPNVVRVIDRGVSADGDGYVVYEYVEGGDLREWIENRSLPLPPREATALVANIARGVQAAHTAGLVHCDLKPGNIIMTSQGEPKVADFGVASAAGDRSASARRNARHVPIGNLAFISPEQYRMDEGALTPRSDIYALGGLLYLLLTGDLPNGRTIEEIGRTHHPAHGRKSPPPVPTGIKGVDRELVLICHRALAVRAEDRYQTAGEFADDLDAWRRHEPIRWTKPSPARIAQLWVRRNPWLAVACLLVIVSIVGGGAVASYFAGRAVQEAIGREREANATASFLQPVAITAKSRKPTTRLLEVAWSAWLVSNEESLVQHTANREVWLASFYTIQKFIEQGEADGRGDHLKTLMYKTVLAFWLVGVNELDRADALLADVDEHMRPMLQPGDDWLADIDAIAAASRVRRLYQTSDTRVLTNADREQLKQAERVLRDHEAFLTTNNPGSPLHYLVLETMQIAFGRALLNDPESHEWAADRLNHYNRQMFVMTREEYAEYLKKNRQD